MRVFRDHGFTRALYPAVAVLAIGIGLVGAGPLTDKGTQPGLTYPLLSASDCRGCHAHYDTPNNIEPWDTWAGSMMAQGGRDPLFWAALDVANNDLADSGDYCLRCHSPVGWLGGRSEPQTDGCGLEGKMDEMDKDFDGLECHVCHRMEVNASPPPGEDPVYFENGQFWIDDSDCGGEGEPCRHGPYEYPADGSVPPPHAWAWSQYQESSDICGNCHNVTNPVKTLIKAGVDTGVPFPIERTFKEWQQSDFRNGGLSAQTCSNCHQPDATSSPAFACTDRTNHHTGDLPQHRFAGGNAWIPDVLRNEYPDLNIDSELIATRGWALDMLQNQSATLELTAPASVEAGESLELEVTITNLTGHKLPTGYPEGRRMWIDVEVRDAFDAPVWESGGWDPVTGVLAEDPQIKIYHVEPGIWNYNGTNECDVVDGAGNPIFHFVLNNCIAVDNRIPPLGFTGGTDLETQPVGYTYPETSPGSGILVNYDTTVYSVQISPGTPSPLSITASVKYQTTTKEYVDFLLAEALANDFPADCIPRNAGLETRSRGEILMDNWALYGKSAPVTMAAETAVVPVIIPALIFTDSFESGDTSQWSSTVGGP